MSLLDPDKKKFEVDHSMQGARHLAFSVGNRFDRFKRDWERDMDVLWKSENPQLILDKLGSDAAQLFILSGKTVAFLESVEKGCTQEKLKLVKPFSINEDGSVTILE
ncbi:hypothetical protein N9955_00035 [bacterium]|nr:hypothetical protein [bacterium]